MFVRTDGTFAVKIFSEETVRLLVDPPADGRIGNGHFLIEAPVLWGVRCYSTSNRNMHPGLEGSSRKPDLSMLTTPNVRFPASWWSSYSFASSRASEPQSKV